MKLTNTVAAAAAMAVLASCGGSGVPTADSMATSAIQTAPVASPQSQASNTVPGRYIVVLKPGTPVSSIASLTAGLAKRPDFTYDVALVGFAGALSAAEKSRLSADPRVAYIEPDAIMQTCAQTLPWGVDRIDADLNANEGTSIGVAVIDTGINQSHPDLAGNIVSGVNFVKSGSQPEDDNGHGTHVAGTIAAVNNSIGYLGVAAQAKVIPVKVLDRRGSGFVSTINAGINWVAANAAAKNIKVANMSLGGSGYQTSMHDAIVAATAAGVTFVVAAGNSRANAANYSPSGFDDTVITVSALNSNGTFASSYSNYGSVVDLIAPGTNIPSLWKGGAYNTISGTSMASPHVAGAAALYFANGHPSAGFAEVRSALIAAGESGTWAGDPDGVYEPLVNAETL